MSDDSPNKETDQELDALKNNITIELRRWNQNPHEVMEKIFPVVYDTLRNKARYLFREEKRELTLQTAGLINELYMKLLNYDRMMFQNRLHFFAFSSQLMRHILVDFSRNRLAKKRPQGSGLMQDEETDLDQVAMEAALDRLGVDPAVMLAIDNILNELTKIDERKARIVNLHFFGGLTFVELAELFEVSERTILRDWRLARAFLARHLGDANPMQK